MITLVRILLHKQYYQREIRPSHGSSHQMNELNNDEDSECICFMIS
jgi:hypothetical protein